eukprot:SAG22_NODE_499_length_9725_cov_2.325784_6_plen_106_part_00
MLLLLSASLPAYHVDRVFVPWVAAEQKLRKSLIACPPRFLSAVEPGWVVIRKQQINHLSTDMRASPADKKKKAARSEQYLSRRQRLAAVKIQVRTIRHCLPSCFH